MMRWAVSRGRETNEAWLADSESIDRGGAIALEEQLLLLGRNQLASESAPDYEHQVPLAGSQDRLVPIHNPHLLVGSQQHIVGVDVRVTNDAGQPFASEPATVAFRTAQQRANPLAPRLPACGERTGRRIVEGPCGDVGIETSDHVSSFWRIRFSP